MAPRDTATLVRRALEPDEAVVATARCWVAVRRPRVPLLVQGRHRCDAVLTDRRLILVDRPGRSRRPRGVTLAHRYEALTLVAGRHRGVLVQQRLRTPADTVVIEWSRRDRHCADRVARAAGRPPHAPIAVDR
jgi:hypothetical protein